MRMRVRLALQQWWAVVRQTMRQERIQDDQRISRMSKLEMLRQHMVNQAAAGAVHAGGGYARIEFQVQQAQVALTEARSVHSEELERAKRCGQGREAELLARAAAVEETMESERATYVQQLQRQADVRRQERESAHRQHEALQRSWRERKQRELGVIERWVDAWLLRRAVACWRTLVRAHRANDRAVHQRRLAQAQLEQQLERQQQQQQQQQRQQLRQQQEQQLRQLQQRRRQQEQQEQQEQHEARKRGVQAPDGTPQAVVARTADRMGTRGHSVSPMRLPSATPPEPARPKVTELDSLAAQFMRRVGDHDRPSARGVGVSRGEMAVAHRSMSVPEGIPPHTADESSPWC
jgi:hypothetical protein